MYLQMYLQRYQAGRTPLIRLSYQIELDHFKQFDTWGLLTFYKVSASDII